MTVFEITDQDTGTVHRFPAPSAEDITVKEWAALVCPPLQSTKDFRSELEDTYELARRYAGIPDSLLRKMPLSSLRTLMDTLEDIASKARDARKEGEPIPATITHLGVTYTVPKDPGTGITFGQYESVLQELSKHEWQDDSIAVVLACILTPEGTTWSTDGLDDRIRAFQSLQAYTAIRLSAFFFAGSKPLNDTWSRFMSARLTSKLQAAQQALTASPDATADTLA